MKTPLTFAAAILLSGCASTSSAPTSVRTSLKSRDVVVECLLNRWPALGPKVSKDAASTTLASVGPLGNKGFITRTTDSESGSATEIWGASPMMTGLNALYLCF